jgi:CheY-like chemotaxis protein
MSAGFDGFVSKPVNLKEFIATLASFLGKGQGGGKA